MKPHRTLLAFAKELNSYLKCLQILYDEKPFKILRIDSPDLSEPINVTMKLPSWSKPKTFAYNTDGLWSELIMKKYTWNYSIRGTRTYLPVFITVEAVDLEEAKQTAQIKIGQDGTLWGDPEIDEANP